MVRVAFRLKYKMLLPASSYVMSNHSYKHHSNFRYCDWTGIFLQSNVQVRCLALFTSLLLQHVVFFVLRAIDWLVPDVPESLELKIKRERYLAKQALAENQEALLVSRGQGAAPATPGTSSPGQ